MHERMEERKRKIINTEREKKTERKKNEIREMNKLNEKKSVAN